MTRRASSSTPRTKKKKNQFACLNSNFFFPFYVGHYKIWKLKIEGSKFKTKEFEIWGAKKRKRTNEHHNNVYFYTLIVWIVYHVLTVIICRQRSLIACSIHIFSHCVICFFTMEKYFYCCHNILYSCCFLRAPPTCSSSIQSLKFR